MTTIIVYNIVDPKTHNARIGMLADTRMSGSWGYPAKKLKYLAKREIIAGFAGKVSDLSVAWASDLEEIPDKIPDAVIVAVTAGGVLHLSEGGPLVEPIHGAWDYYAVGSGSGYAMGALRAGASMEQAIKIAASMDEFTSGPYIRMEFVPTGVIMEELNDEGIKASLGPVQTDQPLLPFGGSDLSIPSPRSVSISSVQAARKHNPHGSVSSAGWIVEDFRRLD